MRLCRPRTATHVVGDRQTSRPFLRRDFAIHGGKQRLRVFVRNRQHGNLLNHFAFADGEALGILGGAHSGCERIARIVGVLNASTLHTFFGPVGAFGINIACSVSVVCRIGVDDATLGSVFVRNFGFDPAPSTAIAGDDDRVLHRDAHAFELVVVIAHSIVHVHERTGYVAVAGVGGVRR